MLLDGVIYDGKEELLQTNCSVPALYLNYGFLILWLVSDLALGRQSI